MNNQTLFVGPALNQAGVETQEQSPFDQWEARAGQIPEQAQSEPEQQQNQEQELRVLCIFVRKYTLGNLFFYHLLRNSLERIIKGGAFYTKSPANRSLTDTGI